jgi:hypothetical protein
MRQPNEIKIGDYTLAEILERHAHWLNEDCDGWERMRADLRGANIQRAYLQEANLQEANLQEADLQEADLQWANLRGAALQGANLRGAYIQEANLQEADLQWANLRRAYLQRANLRGAYIQEANLQEADLRGANLQEADLHGARDVPFIPMACPDAGAFVAWKKIRTVNDGAAIAAIAKLLIPDGVPRSSATGRKCRAERAKVLEIQDIDGNEINVSGTSLRSNSALTYRAGDMVIADLWDEDRWNECSHGIHFFINRQEAVDY